VTLVVFKRDYPPGYVKGQATELPDAMAWELEQLGAVEIRPPNLPTETKEDA
jgi:hypothetical protein